MKCYHAGHASFGVFYEFPSLIRNYLIVVTHIIMNCGIEANRTKKTMNVRIIIDIIIN